MLLFPVLSFADELPKESVLPLAMASKAAQAAVEACKKDGYRVSASVVDRAGVLRTMGRADGAGSHTVESSRKKAYTAASLRRATTELAELIGKVPTLQSLREMNDEILILGGGLPIEIGGDVVHRGHIWTMPALKPDLMLWGRLPKFPRSSDRQLGKGQSAWLYRAPQWM
jgi:uncharacterized protein GlcG (DUF336 family)